MTKRLFDLVCVIPGLIVLSPVLALVAVWIKFDSKGPVFFRQERVGLHMRNFRIFKFRTMVQNAESLGPKVTVGEDRRITKSGHFIRRYKLDELPQLLNVLLGDMSLVGPRPEVPEYVERYYPANIRAKVFSVRPGITEKASIEFSNESEILAASKDPHRTYTETIIPKKLAHYEDYVENHNLVHDVKLIFQTLVKIAK